MSTGTPVSSADANPPASRAGHGHSRSRGHSRSTRYSQVPNPIAVPSPLPPVQPQSPQPVVGTAYSNSHASHPSWHGHHHSRSQSSVHYDQWTPSPVTTVFEDHRMEPNHEPDTPVLLVEPETSRGNEILTGFLIALPWIALSWFSTQYAQSTTLESPVDDVDEITASAYLEGIGSKACALTAGILVLLGCGEAARKGQELSIAALPKLSGSIASSAFIRACSIGLPVYAGLGIGGFLVAFALSLAFASGIPTVASNSVQERFGQKKLTIGLLAIVVLFNLFGTGSSLDEQPFMGYVALLVAVFVIRPPFAVDLPGSTSEITPDPLSPRKSSEAGLPSDTLSDNALVNLLSGVLLALATVIVSGIPSPGGIDLIYFGLTTGAFAVSFLYSSSSGIRSPQKLGHAVGAGAASLFCSPSFQNDLFTVYVSRCVIAAVSVLTARFDDRHLRLEAHSHNHTHHHHHHGHSHSHKEPSRMTKTILHFCEPYPLLYSILKERDSRRIFYFMTLNFGFMMVQLSYGFLTGSLGLLSDSIHMFFDCLALVVGLCAAVMSKWPPNSRFPYGYGKVDTLSGFANGIFLMIISIEIIYEAVERLSSGSQMHRIGELLVVSFAGLLVNLVGIMAFEHGHAHHGHDHGHGHSHGNENMHGIFLHILADTLGSVAVVISTILVHYSGWAGYDPIASCLIAILIFASAVPLVTSTAKSLLLTLPADVEYNLRDTLGGVSDLRGVVGYTVPKFWLDDTNASGDDHGHHHHDHGHSHSHSHGHGHNHSHSHSHSHSHDHGHDHGHGHGHSHSHSHHSHCADHDHHDHDHDHDSHNPHVLGVIHVIASRGADLEDVRQRTIDFLREKNMDVTVQVEREGDGRCWCGGNKNP